MPENKAGTEQIEERNLAAEIKELQAGIARLGKEIEDKDWASRKTNECIKVLYKELEKKNEELKKFDQLKSQFVANVSHEMRTPLSIVSEGISLVLDKIPGELNAKQEKLLNACKNNIDRLTRIINSLLDMAKIEAGKVDLRKTMVSLTRLLEQVYSSFELKAKERGLELKANWPEESLEVYVDADKIIQVLTNLVNNAVKFTEKGRIEISARLKENEIECAVADTGKGLAQEEQAMLFNRFQQFGRVAGAGEKGTGLGLAIAKSLIEMHNGKIWAESEPGRGTKFTFTLPLARPQD